jgi:tetratricopeptide (TPR) repeat protein
MPKDAEAHYQLALALLASRNYLASLKELNQAVQLDPKHRDAQLKLAELKAAVPRPQDEENPAKARISKQYLEESQKTVQDLIKSGESSAEILDTLAVTELKLNDQAAAEKTLEEAVARFPKDLASAVGLAKVKLAHKDPAGAEAVLKKAVSEQPKSANAALALGQYYLAAKKPADAESQFQRAVELDPKSAPALISLAVLQTRTNKLEQAEQTYARLSALPDEQYRSYHAAFLAARGKQDQATAEFERLNRQYPDDRLVRTGLARQYLRVNRGADAEKLVTAALTKHPKDTDALLQRAGIYLLTRRTDAAEKDLDRVLHLRNDSAQAHYLMSMVHGARGSTLNQRQELGQALRLQPGLLAVRLQLARVLLATGSAQASLDLLTAKESPQNNTLVIVAENWALIGLRRYDEARKQVDRALAVVRLPELLVQDAVLKKELKDYAGARTSLTEELNRAPEDLRALNLLVSTYADEKHPAAAIQAVRERSAKFPNSAPLQLFLAQVLMSNHQNAAARTALAAAKAANPQFTPADLILARLDFSEGRVDEAAKALSGVLTQQPDNVGARMLLAAIHETKGNDAGAIEDYKKVLQSQPGNVLALNNLAFELSKNHDQLDEALKYAQKGAELAPETPAIENTLGWVLYQKGLYSMAVPHLEKAASREPNARRECHLAMAYLQLGDQERGQQYLTAAMKLDPNLPEIKTALRILDQKQSDKR